jgi:hypothetical protein
VPDEQQRRGARLGHFGRERIHEVKRSTPGFVSPATLIFQGDWFFRTTNRLEADVWLVLTCSIREGAENKGIHFSNLKLTLRRFHICCTPWSSCEKTFPHCSGSKVRNAEEKSKNRSSGS